MKTSIRRNVASTLLASFAAIALAGCATTAGKSQASSQQACFAADSARAPAESAGAEADPAARQTVAKSFQPADASKIKVAFFDADSTLRVSVSGSVSANGPTDVMALPFIGPKLKRLAADGYLIAIVSNQGGIAAGEVTLEDADAALRYTINRLEAQGGVVHYYDFAENKDEYRKPQPGMGNRLELKLKELFGPTAQIDKSASFMVGDSAYKKPGTGFAGDTQPNGKMGTHFSNADRLFAANFGVAFHEPADYFGWRAMGVDIFENKPQVDAFLAEFVAPLCPKPASTPESGTPEPKPQRPAKKKKPSKQQG